MTVVTRAFAVGVPDFPHRVLRRSLQGAEALSTDAVGSQETPGGERVELGRFYSDAPTRSFRGHVKATPFYAGKGVDGIDSIRPAGEIVTELTAGLPEGRTRRAEEVGRAS